MAFPAGTSLDIEIARGEAIEILIPGHINLDTLVARVDQGTITIDVNDDSVRSLPPKLQRLLTEHEAAGTLKVQINGFMPLTEPAAGLLSLDVGVERFHVTSGDYTFPIDSLVLEAGLSDGEIGLTRFDVDTLGGTITANASIPLFRRRRECDLEHREPRSREADERADERE